HRSKRTNAFLRLWSYARRFRTKLDQSLPREAARERSNQKSEVSTAKTFYLESGKFDLRETSANRCYTQSGPLCFYDTNPGMRLYEIRHKDLYETNGLTTARATPRSSHPPRHVILLDPVPVRSTPREAAREIHLKTNQ